MAVEIIHELSLQRICLTQELKNMKIGFDAKRAFFNDTGLGNYSRSLLQAIVKQYPEHEYFLYTPKQPSIVLLEATQLNTPFIIKSPQKKMDQYFGGSLWRSLQLGQYLAKDELDVYHGLSHELPFDSYHIEGKKVVTMHDLISFRYPKLYPFFDRWMYRQKWMHSCQVADRIIAVSEQTKRDIVQFLGVAAEKIKVIYPTCNPIFYDYSDLIYLQHGFFPDERYQILNQLPQQFILYVGSIIERKNLLSLVKAVELLKSKLDVPLVVVGEGKKYKEKVQAYIAEKQLEKQVIFLTDVPTKQLPILYRKAETVVYPSVFEGFGLPLVEALASQTAVIAATGSCLEEAGGPNSIYVEPYNVEAIANAIEQVLTDEELNNKMVKAGWEYAKQFTPQNMAQQTMDVYKS